MNRVTEINALARTVHKIREIKDDALETRMLGKKADAIQRGLVVILNPAQIKKFTINIDASSEQDPSAAQEENQPRNQEIRENAMITLRESQAFLRRIVRHRDKAVDNDTIARFVRTAETLRDHMNFIRKAEWKIKGESYS